MTTKALSKHIRILGGEFEIERHIGERGERSAVRVLDLYEDEDACTTANQRKEEDARHGFGVVSNTAADSGAQHAQAIDKVASESHHATGSEDDDDGYELAAPKMFTYEHPSTVYGEQLPTPRPLASKGLPRAERLKWGLYMGVPHTTELADDTEAVVRYVIHALFELGATCVYRNVSARSPWLLVILDGRVLDPTADQPVKLIVLVDPVAPAARETVFGFTHIIQVIHDASGDPPVTAIDGRHIRFAYLKLRRSIWALAKLPYPGGGRLQWHRRDTDETKELRLPGGPPDVD